MNKPFIVIPLPTAKDNHQMENAKFYEKAGCCWILNQKNLDKEKLNRYFIKNFKQINQTILIKKKI